MKRIFILFIFLFTLPSLFAQAPQSFKYQAVLRYNDGSIVQNQLVNIRISILSETPVGNAVYVETHSVSTNQFGIANLNVGEGDVQTGSFASINWGISAYYIQTELDLTGTNNYEFIGTSRLESVPYALFAANAVNVDDEDADPTNEIQIISLTGNILTLSNGGQVDLSIYLDNTDEQDLNLSGNTLYISNGQSVDLTPYLDNTDEQELNLTGTELSIINGNSISLDTMMDNTDEQSLYLDGTILGITSGNSVELGGTVDLDADPTNELQVITISNDTIFLSDGGFAVLPAGFDGQYSSLTGAPEKISDLELNASSNKIFNLQNPEDPHDAVTKAYVDNLTTILSNAGVNIVDFSISTNVLLIEDIIYFEDLSTMNGNEWFWDFGDGNHSYLQNPEHSYDESGVYDVCLTLSDSVFSFTKCKEGIVVVYDLLYDIEGNAYKTLGFGDQVWMAENLRSTVYANGEPLIDGTGMNDISGDYTNKYYFNYNDDPILSEIYGKLYTWAAIVNDSEGSQLSPSGIQGICPDGWHVPSDLEWKELEIYLGMSQSEADSVNFRGTVEGSMLADSIGTDMWGNGELVNNDYFGITGFNALPGGRRLVDQFMSINGMGIWWTSTSFNSTSSWYREIYHSYSKVKRYDGAKSNGYSIRCVKD